MARPTNRVAPRVDRPTAPLTPALSALLSRGTSPPAATRSTAQTTPPSQSADASLPRNLASQLCTALLLADLALVALGGSLVVNLPLSPVFWRSWSCGIGALTLGGWLGWLAWRVIRDTRATQ